MRESAPNRPKEVTCTFCLKLMAFPQRVSRHRLSLAPR
jgi:hypothetical protein